MYIPTYLPIYVRTCLLTYLHAYTYIHTTLLKNIKESNILDFDGKFIFSEQDNANQFLPISSFSFI